MKSRSVGLSSDDIRFKLELADFYAAAAWYYLMQGEFSKFDTFFNQAAVMNSDYTEFVKSDLLLGRFQKFQAAEYYIRGLSKERINCDAEALEAYRYIIIALDDNYVPAWMRLEYLYRKFGMKQDAEKAAQGQTTHSHAIKNFHFLFFFSCRAKKTCFPFHHQNINTPPKKTISTLLQKIAYGFVIAAIMSYVSPFFSHCVMPNWMPTFLLVILKFVKHATCMGTMRI